MTGIRMKSSRRSKKRKKKEFYRTVNIKVPKGTATIRPISGTVKRHQDKVIITSDKGSRTGKIKVKAHGYN